MILLFYCSYATAFSSLLGIPMSCRYNSLCAYMGDDDMFSSDLNEHQLKMRLGHMSSTPCQVPYTFHIRSPGSQQLFMSFCSIYLSDLLNEYDSQWYNFIKILHVVVFF